MASLAVKNKHQKDMCYNETILCAPTFSCTYTMCTLEIQTPIPCSTVNKMGRVGCVLGSPFGEANYGQ